MGTPLLNTISAASGSANILNSAEGDIPYKVSATHHNYLSYPSFYAGFFVKANAILVNGPIGHNVMLLGGCSSIVSIRKSIASFSAKELQDRKHHSIETTIPMRVFGSNLRAIKWLFSASVNFCFGLPAKSQIMRAFLHVRSNGTFPATTVRPTTSSSSLVPT